MFAYAIELPDGTIATRKSKREYAYVVVVRTGQAYADSAQGRKAGEWAVISYHSRFALAKREAEKWHDGSDYFRLAMPKAIMPHEITEV